MVRAPGKYVSRAGEKLEAALDAFSLDVSGGVCADFGCNIGGFTDCLLRRGAARVHALDTGYGALDWQLRNDDRVCVLERTNAQYCPPAESVDLVVIDVAWTPQELIVPAAIGWLKSNTSSPRGGRIVSLLKPHYELSKMQQRKPPRTLSLQKSQWVCMEVCRRLEQIGCTVRAVLPTDLPGKGGNTEFFLLLTGRTDSGQVENDERIIDVQAFDK